MTIPTFAAGLTIGFIAILVCLAVFCLRRHPLSLDRFRRTLEVSLSEMAAPLHATVGALELTNVGFFGLEITAREIRLLSDDSHTWVSFGHITFRAPVSAALSSSTLNRSTKPWAFSGATVDALAPQTPFESLHGIATATDDTLRFDIAGGRWGESTIDGGVVTLEGLESDLPRADISFRCGGGATHALQVVTTPPLDLVNPSILQGNPVRGSIEADIRLVFAFDELPRMEHRTRAEIRHLRLPQVFAGQGLTEGNFDVTVTNEESTFEGTAHLGGIPTTLRYSMSVENHLEKLTVNTADIGALVASLDISGRLIGGRLKVALDRLSQHGDGPWSGSAEAHNVRILQAPLLARLLTMASLSGLVSTLSNNGLTVGHARAEITASPERIRCTSIRISIDQLEITGTIDYCRNTGHIESEGLLIPAASLQRLVGAVPVLGAILEGFGKKNTPIAATRFTLKGQLSQPEIKVFPLSSLRPDILSDLGIV